MDTALLEVPAQAVASVGAAAPSAAGGVLQMVASLLVVLAVIFALAWLARALQRARGGQGGSLRLHAGLQVGPKERVVLLQVGDQHFLVGVAAGGVSLLHRFMVAPVPSEVRAELSPFAEKLRQMLQRDVREPKSENVF